MVVVIVIVAVVASVGSDGRAGGGRKCRHFGWLFTIVDLGGIE
jgi:hypothetical protein